MSSRKSSFKDIFLREKSPKNFAVSILSTIFFSKINFFRFKFWMTSHQVWIFFQWKFHFQHKNIFFSIGHHFREKISEEFLKIRGRYSHILWIFRSYIIKVEVTNDNEWLQNSIVSYAHLSLCPKRTLFLISISTH